MQKETQTGIPIEHLVSQINWLADLVSFWNFLKNISEYHVTI